MRRRRRRRVQQRSAASRKNPSYGRRKMRIFNTIAWTASVIMVLNMLPSDSLLAMKLAEYEDSLPVLSLGLEELASPLGTADAGQEEQASENSGEAGDGGGTAAESGQTEKSDETEGEVLSENTVSDSEKSEIGGIEIVLTSLKTDSSVIEGDSGSKKVSTELKVSEVSEASELQIVEGGAEKKISDAKGSGTVLIYHTHATEAYQPILAESTHVTNLAGTVREGAQSLKDALTDKGYNVVHDLTLHDYPSYNKSYNRSLETGKSLISKYPDAVLMVDFHRDAASAGKGKTAVINGEKVASFCLVVGTQNANYNILRSFAEKITSKANEMYPGFSTGIVEKPYKFNEYLSDNYILLEMGNNENTIEQVNAAAPYLADVLANITQ